MGACDCKRQLQGPSATLTCSEITSETCSRRLCQRTTNNGQLSPGETKALSNCLPPVSKFA